MDYSSVVTLVLTLAAALLALNSEPYKKGKVTKTGWIAMVAILAFLAGIYDVYIKEMEKKALKELACDEILPHVKAIAESEEKEELFKLRGASQDPELLMRLHAKVKTAKNELDLVATRHISSLGFEERSTLIALISSYAVIDDILSRGYTDFMGSAARGKLYQMEKAGIFEICSR
jgi:hypothetical protein